MKSIMSNLEKSHAENPVTSTEKVRDMIDKQLGMNQMEDLRDNFKVLLFRKFYAILCSPYG